MNAGGTQRTSSGCKIRVLLLLAETSERQRKEVGLTEVGIEVSAEVPENTVGPITT